MDLKTEEVDLVKDKATGALLNTNASAYEAYKRAREQRVRERHVMEQRFSKLETQVSELTTLLKTFLEANIK